MPRLRRAVGGSQTGNHHAAFRIGLTVWTEDTQAAREEIAAWRDPRGGVPWPPPRRMLVSSDDTRQLGITGHSSRANLPESPMSEERSRKSASAHGQLLSAWIQDAVRRCQLLVGDTPVRTEAKQNRDDGHDVAHAPANKP